MTLPMLPVVPGILARALGAGALCLLTACTTPEPSALARQAPELPARWVAALDDPDLERFEEFAKSEGAANLIQVMLRVLNSADTSSIEAWAATFSVAEPALTRLRRVLRDEFGFQRQWELHRQFLELSDEEAARCHREIRQAYAVARDKSIVPSRRAELMLAIVERLDARGAPISTSPILLQVAASQGESGDDVAQRRTLERCVALARDEGNHRILCQALGVLGSWHQARHDEEAMLRCWNDGLAIAREHRLAEQVGRLLSFQSNHYASRGRLTLARELLREASQATQDLGGSPADIRFLVAWLDFNARLGCWDLVSRDLRRADPLFQRSSEWFGQYIVRHWSARFEGYRSYVAIRSGEVDMGNRGYRHAEAILLEQADLGPLATLRRHWAEALNQQGQLVSARSVLQRGYRDAADSEAQAEFLALLAAQLARLEDWAACADAITRYDALASSLELPPSGEKLLRDIACVRLSRATGDVEKLRARTAHLLRQTATLVATLPNSQEGNLGLRQIHPLRNLLHDLVGGDPRAELALEYLWREIPEYLSRAVDYEQTPFARCERVLGRAFLGASEVSNGDEDPIERVLTDSTTEQVQLVYRFTDQALLRWRREGSTVSRSEIAVPEDSVQVGIARLLDAIDHAPGPDTATRLAPETLAQAHSLAQLLLPSDLLVETGELASDATRLLIVPDGCLYELPFGVLSAEEQSYVPMILRAEFTYLGTVSSRLTAIDTTPADSARGPMALIVADPATGGSFAARSGGLPPLPAGLGEAQHLQGLLPSSQLLTGAAATKSNLVERWQGASVLYFASHVVRDPEQPYLSYLPLAAQASSRDPSSDSVDLNDLATVEFRARPTVVLSACSSGSPYLVHGSRSPGLGEGFLRAGASTVLQSYWSVRDDDVAELMMGVIDRWISGGVSPARALHEVRRAFATSKGSERWHPYYWGGMLASIRMEMGSTADASGYREAQREKGDAPRSVALPTTEGGRSQ